MNNERSTRPFTRTDQRALALHQDSSFGGEQ